MRRSAAVLATLLPCCALLSARRAAAQELRGTVRDSASTRPVPGAVVLLLGADSRAMGRNITNELGEYRVALAPGMTRVRVLRLGFRPREADIPAPVGGIAHLDIAMATIPTMLEAVRVTSNASCPRRGDEAAAFALLEQARAGLLASVVSRETNVPKVVRYAFDRTHDGTSDRISRMTVDVDSANTSASFAAVRSAKAFVRRGFMDDSPEGATFYAPDAEVLLDSAFSNAYCFRLVGDKHRATQVGLAFTAAKSERKRVDVEGTLWVDTSARKLEDIEFVYRGIDPSVDKLHPGGTISFHEMPNGSIMIDRWMLRLIGAYVDTVMAMGAGAFSASGGTEPRERVNYYIHERGGELAHARWPDGTTWDGALATLQATAKTANGLPAVHAEVTLPGTPYRGVTDGLGQVTIRDLVPGPYQGAIVDSALRVIDLTIPTNLAFTATEASTIVKPFVAPTLEEFVIDRCIADKHYTHESTDTTRVIARVFDAQRHPLDRVRWQAWATGGNYTDALHVQPEWREVREDGTTGTDGVIALCSPKLKRAGTVEIRALRDDRTYAVHRPLPSRVTVIAIPLAAQTAVANVDLSKPPAAVAARTAVFAGVVVTDSTNQPIPGAEVALPELGLSVRADTNGRFRIADVPPGEQHVQIRRLGFGAADATLVFTAGQTVTRRVVLGRAVTLEAMDINAEAVHIPSFDEHKRTGLGHFMERAEIAKFDGMKLSSVLQSIPALDVVQTHVAGYVMSRRAPPPNPLCTGACLAGEGYYIGSPAKGEPAVGCYALIYLDGVLVNGMREPTEPFDINSIPPDRVESIEWYAGPSETPVEYTRMGTKCGVLVIWTTMKKK